MLRDRHTNKYRVLYFVIDADGRPGFICVRTFAAVVSLLENYIDKPDCITIRIAGVRGDRSDRQPASYLPPPTASALRTTLIARRYRIELETRTYDVVATVYNVTNI